MDSSGRSTSDPVAGRVGLYVSGKSTKHPVAGELVYSGIPLALLEDPGDDDEEDTDDAAEAAGVGKSGPRSRS